MLVIGATPRDGGVNWRGRRHDDDGPGAISGVGVDELFTAVFEALHDGEQVAIGFPAPLGLIAPPGDDVVTAAANDSDAIRELGALLGELGKWRPWTVVSTSLPRWRATTSVLVWESTEADLDPAVEAFFDLARSRASHGAEARSGELTNVAAALALRAGLTVDQAQLDEPVVRVSVR